MYPEVEQYIKTRDEATATYQAAIDAANAKHGNRYDNDASYSEWRVETDEAHRTQRVTINEAWNGLKASSDPLVGFIVENCKEYQDYAIEVLKKLPAPLETLDDLAYDSDWCNVWNRFRDAAVARGLFPEVKQPSEARKALLTWAERSYGMGRSYVKQLNELVDAVVAEEAATA